MGRRFLDEGLDTFERFRDQGRTIVFVTHDMALVERFCTRALMLEGGEIVAFGSPSAVAVEYMRANFDQLTAETAEQSAEIERFSASTSSVWSAGTSGSSSRRTRTRR